MSLRRNRTLALLTIAITIIAVAACKRSGGDDDGSVGAGDPTNPANPINPTPSSSEDERGSVGVPPTGAAYCVDLGFTLTADSKCQFPDGTSCEEWSFYRGECGQTHSYCNQHGGTIANRIEDAGNLDGDLRRLHATWQRVPRRRLHRYRSLRINSQPLARVSQMRPVPITPKPGQESVWDYPRPPRIEPVNKRIRIALGGKTIVDTTNDVLRVLETSHPPVYYVAITDVLEGILRASTSRTTFCEFKGVAHYYNVANERDAAWGYVDGLLKGHIAFYASRMDACFVDDERVTPQPGVFYGGWITSDIVGPFKGEPGTQGW